MNDQANILRQLVRQEADGSPNAISGDSRLIVVTAGKGGVGATTIAVNLALALAQSGRSCLLVDGDTTSADATALCGLDAQFGVSHVIAGWRSVGETMLDGPENIRVLPGIWDREHDALWTESAQERLIDELRKLRKDAEFVVVDAGNGLSSLTGRFCRGADLVLMVSTPDAMSIMDAYAAIKVHSEQAAAVTIRTLVNRAADTQNAAEVHARLARACQRFLSLPVTDAGYVPIIQRDEASSDAEYLFVRDDPQSTATLCLQRLAQTVSEPSARTSGQSTRISAASLL